jgi:Tol biopolymer transport system component
VHSSRGRLLCGLAVIALASAAAAPAPSRGAPQANWNGRIAFDSLRGGNRDIYAIASPPCPLSDPSFCHDGGRGTPAPDPAPQRVTTDPAPDTHPSWLPTSIRRLARPHAIAFARTTPDGNTDIYHVEVPESATNVAQRVTTDPRADSAPSWASEPLPGSPGSLPRFALPPIAFERNVDGTRDIFIANYDGSDVTNLTNSPGVDDANPDWAHYTPWEDDQAFLTFDSDRSGQRDVWAMGVSYDQQTNSYRPTALRPVTHDPQPASAEPSWFGWGIEGSASTSVDWVAFAGPNGDGRVNQISYAEFDRRNPGTLALTSPFSDTRTAFFTLGDGTAQETAPAWSPTGDRVAYQSGRDGNEEIYVMDPLSDGPAGDVNVSQFAGDDRNPDWEPIEQRDNEAYPIQPKGRRAKRPRASKSSLPQPQPNPDSPPPTGASGRPPISLRCTVSGTRRNDVLRGTNRRDVLCGKGGRDRIYGGAGDDIIRGGAGADRLFGGRGRDYLLGGVGDDHLDGGPGVDTLEGGAGRDRINARDRAHDRIDGGRGRDRATTDKTGDRVMHVETVQRGRRR